MTPRTQFLLELSAAVALLLGAYLLWPEPLPVKDQARWTDVEKPVAGAKP